MPPRPVPEDRQRGNCAGRLNAGNGIESRNYLIKKSPDDFLVLILRLGQTDAEGEDIVRDDARIHVLQFDETAHHQARADKQNQRDRNFRDDEPVPNALTARSARSGATAFFQNFRQVRT